MNQDRRLPRAAFVRASGAIASGAMLAFAFPPTGLWPLAILSVSVMVLSVRGVSAPAGLGLGMLQGLVTFGVLLHWMTIVGTDAWILLVALCAAWMGLVGAMTALVCRLALWPLWVASTWVAVEALRDRIPLGGFPWGRLAYSQSDSALTAYASLAGAPLVTFVAALTGALIAAAITGHADPRRAIAASVMVAVVIVGGAVLPLPDAGQGDPDRVVAAVVQGSVPTVGISARDDRRAVMANHVRQTLLLAGEVAAGRQPQPDFVVWPENSTDIDPLADAAAASQITSAARAIGVPILVGAVVADPAASDRVLNVGIVWDPVTGPGQVYVKTHPVPFGEYVPMRSLLTRLVGRFELVPRDFSAGSVPGVLRLGPAVVGDVICFEVAYDEVVRDVVTGGGRAIVVQTNNATYAGTGQPEQQMAISRLRAVEHGRTVLVASTSGISGIVRPDGVLELRLPDLQPGTLVAPVPLRDTITLADRVGDVPEWLLTALALIAAVGGIVVRRRQTSPGSLGSDDLAASTGKPSGAEEAAR